MTNLRDEVYEIKTNRNVTCVSFIINFSQGKKAFALKWGIIPQCVYPLLITALLLRIIIRLII